MFNADDYKNVNREQWQATAQAWPGDYVLDLAAGNGPASSPRVRVLISPMVLNLIMASCVDLVLAAWLLLMS